jgi:hypothetical protein
MARGLLGIERNKHPSGRMSNALFGLIQVADGAVRVLSLGFLHTDWLCRYTSWQAKVMFRNLKRNQGQCR